MKINCTESSGTLTIRLAGELDHHAASAVLREAKEVMDNFMPVSAVLDMSGVSFMDSSGIAVVLGLCKHMGGYGGTLSVRNAPKHVMKIMKAAALDRIVTFIGTDS